MNQGQGTNGGQGVNGGQGMNGGHATNDGRGVQGSNGGRDNGQDNERDAGHRGDYDVVVCGAGVGGLASARALNAIGLRVLVVDKQRSPRPVAKGEVLQPGALRALRRWGTDRLLTRNGALRLGRLVVRDPEGGPVMTLDYGRLPPADSSLLAHDHLAVLEALTAGLGPDVEIRRGVRVVEALRDDTGRVVGVRLDDGRGRAHTDGDDGDDAHRADGRTRSGTWDVHAPLVVAADGIGSRLRRAADIGGTRRDYPHRLVSFELADPPMRPEDFSAYLTDRGLRLVYPLPGGRIRLYVQARPGELRGLDRAGFARWGADAVREVPALEPLADAVSTAADTRQLFPVGRFLAERLTAPGLALVGESAFAVHPMAAQGMNAAITSAAALAEQLAARLAPPVRPSAKPSAQKRTTETAPAAGTATGTATAEQTERLTRAAVDEALHGYESERLPVLAQAASTSDKAARMVTELAWPGRVLGRRAVRCTGANPRLLHTVTYNMAGLGPRPLTLLDRLQQLGLLPDPRAHRVPQE
ncbi:FAD-dependent oxidoreductase [Streptomyces marispadix]|uniref:FAD-dependent monooxygenase n=1 Tax=Streptomyces marispadix TaxID=2922868 RepID=A0ABS9SWV9_9ACTN|nr:NAD(P)/FAD-dependent oxidoreductase [Streptomyces marispadix]MCH6160764.1 FAD-dependent monooxygenase [Streptomyces marispadix]